jgi:hypothetical protein
VPVNPLGSNVSASERDRRQKILFKLADEYDRRDGHCPSLFLTPAPAEWANARLKTMGEIWTVPDNKSAGSTVSYNTIVGPCNNIDIHSTNNADASHNTMLGPNNQIHIDDSKNGKADYNYMSTPQTEPNSKK